MNNFQLTESDFVILIELEQDEYAFRFQDIAFYKKLSGQHIKEMDFGYWNGKELLLVELKDLSRGKESDLEKLKKDTDATKELISDLVKKATDSMLMLLSIRLGFQHCTNGFPEEFVSQWKSIELTNNSEDNEKSIPLQLVFVINLPKMLTEAAMGPLKDRYSQVFKGINSIFDNRISSYVMDKRNAMRNFPNIFRKE